MTQRRYTRQIIIRKVEDPVDASPDKQLEWICECLGIDENDELARKIFKALVLAGEKGGGVSTREITDKTHVTQGAVVYHMNFFMRSGIIIKQGRKYFLRSYSLSNTIEEMEQDMMRTMDRMRRIAKLLEEEFRMR